MARLALGRPPDFDELGAEGVAHTRFFLDIDDALRLHPVPDQALGLQPVPDEALGPLPVPDV